ncbi:hypothetical protein HanRHA438_Chr03g0129251 [Helianthus annuus]|nr:hypothetical protein HanRHA438_Chr03g0129251 [Helianthus annuus]
MHIRHELSFFRTMTRFDTHVWYRTFRMIPASRRLFTSFAIALARSGAMCLFLCAIGFIDSFTFRWCCAMDLGTPCMSECFQAKTSIELLSNSHKSFFVCFGSCAPMATCCSGYSGLIAQSSVGTSDFLELVSAACLTSATNEFDSESIVATPASVGNLMAPCIVELIAPRARNPGCPSIMLCEEWVRTTKKVNCTVLLLSPSLNVVGRTTSPEKLITGFDTSINFFFFWGFSCWKHCKYIISKALPPST